MRQALALAALGEGSTSPNPRVGCVLVRDDRVVGSGYHEAAGAAHAEAVAVTAAGDAARGATLYVNLEPCAHSGRTPPCADAIVRSGISRVVAAMQDPNPKVDGKGFERLRAAGITVDVGILEEEARELNAAFVHWHRTGRPLVTLKAALSADGRLSGRDGASHWITGAPARLFTHRLRLRHDAILVGAGTVRADDPSLDVRLGSRRYQRQRIILTRSLELDAGARIFDPATGDPPRIYVPEQAGGGFKGRAEIVRVPGTTKGVDLHAVLDDLGSRGVLSLMVEGGGQVHGAFLEAGLADRTAWFVSPRVLGSAGATPVVDLPAVADPAGAWRIETHRRLPLGNDWYQEGRPCSPV